MAPTSHPKHLRRLDAVWLERPIYFITSCVAGRAKQLASPAAHAILRDELTGAPARHGWLVGRYVAMPDHCHFFCAPGGEGKQKSLADFVGAIKRWTARRFAAELGFTTPFWQQEFFDHLVRSSENYEAKWRYVVDNPVRAGLVANAEDWPFAAEIDVLT